jgi:hypothetical protein
MPSRTRCLVAAFDTADSFYCFRAQWLLSSLAGYSLATTQLNCRFSTRHSLSTRLVFSLYKFGKDRIENTAFNDVVSCCVRICCRGKVFFRAITRQRTMQICHSFVRLLYPNLVSNLFSSSFSTKFLYVFHTFLMHAGYFILLIT